ncbi:hypothetical protein HA402_003809 [Bradysia odoriphaga]|nr:hypothetical protein HA402_003809 [Bradysia odoriphaga]
MKRVIPLIVSLMVASASAATCSRYEWKCADGRQCIKTDELCDGQTNCDDNSDETAQACIGIRCPSYAFRCAYGACVDSDSECNGVKDCADNSDELSLKCPGVLESYDLKGDCKVGNFKCKTSGECIPDDKVCDGKEDCTDRSDETVERCSAYYCPSYGFRCGYGGCIDGASKCDGTVDCADNSDESSTLCGYSTAVPPTSRPTSRPATTARPADEGFCSIPDDLPSNVQAFYEADQTHELPKGSSAAPFSNIVYKCKSKYVLQGSANNFCLNGQWSNTHPECRKYCSPLPLSGVTIKASCEILGETISCQQQHRPQTIARITCAVGYRKPVDRTVIDVLRCDDDGEWDYHAFRCEQICGLEAPEVVPYIVGGERVNITKVPWHTGIFTDIASRSTFSQICGGTIINAKLVISAAHCFWDAVENRLYEASNFKVGAGKYYRDFYATEPTKPQLVDVAQIIAKQEYNDYAGYYALDIALLILVDHFEFNSYIKPICLETNLNFNEKYVQPGLVGKVAGWGLEESGGKSSPELKYIDLPAIEYNECKQKLSAELQLFITGDKFCAGYTTGQAVCRGDSGGGLVFPKQVGSSTVYFLRGIVSTGGNKGGSCDNDKYTLFTNVQYHIEMVQYYETQNRPK